MFLVVAAAPGPRRVEAVAVRRLRRERDARAGVVAAPDAPVDEARLGVVEHAIDGLELARRRGAQRRNKLGAFRGQSAATAASSRPGRHFAGLAGVRAGPSAAIWALSSS